MKILITNKLILNTRIFIIFKRVHISMSIPKLVVRRKSVSPIIAIAILIGLALAGGSVVAVVVNQSTQNVNIPDANTLLGANETNNLILLKAEIAQVFEHPDPQISKDVIGVQVDVTNLASTPVYIQDIDVMIGNTKLDDFAEWSIQSSIGAVKVDADGNPYTPGAEFGGYKQGSGQISYVVQLDESDYGNRFARLPYNTSLFFAQVQVGLTPGNTDAVVPTQIVALKDFYDPVDFRIAMFVHGGETSDAESDLRNMFSDSRFIGLTEAKNILIEFDQNTDKYDFSSPNHGINATAIAENYDGVIVAMWAVHNNIANELKTLYDAGIPLMFYGTLKGFGNYNQIASEINATLTEEITGLKWVGCSICDNVDNGDTDANNTYWFETNSNPGIVTDLKPGAIFFEDSKNMDRDAYDAANLTSNPEVEISVYGYHRFELRDEENGNALFFNHTGPSLVVRISPVGQRVVTFVMDSNELHESRRNRNTADDHTFFVPRNMLFAMLGQERKLIRHATIQMTSFNIVQNPQNSRQFRLEWSFQVKGGDINILDGDLNFTLTMPTDYTISYARGNRIQVTIETSGSTRSPLSKAIRINDPQPSVFVDVADKFGGTRANRKLQYVYYDDNVSVVYPVRRVNRYGWLEISNSDDPAAVKPWTIKTEWSNVDFTFDSKTVTYNRAIQPSSLMSTNNPQGNLDVLKEGIMVFRRK